MISKRQREALGPDYVLLMRGHNYIARTAARSPRTARVIDVTDYPEVNDLILASDSAVLDYSSLRFDYALTGKPMVFLVPDLEQYGGTRGVLFDYTETAPGPLLHTSDEVISVLRNVASLRLGLMPRSTGASTNGSTTSRTATRPSGWLTASSTSVPEPGGLAACGAVQQARPPTRRGHTLFRVTTTRQRRDFAPGT